jgi:hypothetical protein
MYVLRSRDHRMGRRILRPDDDHVAAVDHEPIPAMRAIADAIVRAL